MRIPKTVWTSLLTPAMAVAAPAMAQPAGENAPIIVTGSLPPPPGSIAYGTVVLDSERLAAEPSGRIENALSALAGVQQFRRSDSRSANPSAQGITLRALGGNAASRALVLLDGVPQADPFFGFVPFSLLDAEPMAQARITRGGGAGAFGAGALAGTVELITAGRAGLPRAQAVLLRGSADAVEAQGLVIAEPGSGLVRLSARFERGDGFFTTPDEQRAPADVRARYASWSTGLGVAIPAGANGLVQARLALSRDERTLRFAGADSRTNGQDASLRYLSDGRWQIDALAYLQMRDFSNVVISATSFRPVLDQDRTPSTGAGAKLELRAPPLAGHRLRFGLDLRHATGDAHETALSAASGQVTARRVAGGRQKLLGAFVEDDWTSGSLTLTLGARADHWRQDDGRFVERAASGVVTTERAFADRSGWEASLRGGALWQATPAIAVRGAGYTGFRLPTLNELYRGFTLFPVTTQANAALSPERLRGAEIGIDMTPGPRLRMGATLFANRLENAVANVTIGPNLRQRRNLPAIEAKGLELTGEARVGSVRLTGSWAWSDSRVRGGTLAPTLEGQRPAQSPEHQATLALDWSPREAIRLALVARYVGPQAEDDLGVDRLPDTLTLGGSLLWPLSPRLSLVLRGENLFDAQVLTRKVGGSVDLGTPRTLWFGLRFRQERQ